MDKIIMTTAQTVHKGHFFFENGEIYQIVEKNELRTKHHDYHLVVQNFHNNHRSTRHYSHDHLLHVVEPIHMHYKIVWVVSESESGPGPETLRLELLDISTSEPRSDLIVTDPGLSAYLIAHFEPDDAQKIPEELDAHVYSFTIEPLHRSDKLVTVERIVSVQGYDMSHLYDHHHGQHHIHE